MKLRTFLPPLILVCACLAGCAAGTRSDARHPSAAAVAGRVPLHASDWNYHGEPARQVVSPHYVIYTTILDDQLVDALGQLMEGALAEYERLAPGVAAGERPMECYLFASRDQWTRFTKDHTGADAPVYLHINRGGYTVRDWYVAYYIGDVGTFSVAAHEGFHQYAARHFKTRIPPFLEEGIACMFEDVRWSDGVPRWDLDYNGGRLSSLRSAVEENKLFTLEQLAGTHAGQVVSGPRAQISAFYGQSWAFARFLWTADHGRYRPGLQHMLTDAANGTLHGVPAPAVAGSQLWDPRSAKPLLEYYLQTDLPTLDRRFRQYVGQLVNRSIEAEPNS